MSREPGSWQDEQIHAYVDGTLPAAPAARLEADCQTDADLAARVDRQRQLRELLRAQFDPVLDEPVPRRLLEALDAGPADATVTPISAARRPRATPPAWWSALAASLLLGLMLGWWLAGHGGLPLTTGDGALLARGELEVALSEQLSGSAIRRSGIAVLASLRTGDGRICRAFRLADGADGLACRESAGWRIAALASASPQPPADGDSYRQAASALSPAVAAAMEQQQDGEALSPEEELRARAAGWRDGLL